MATADVGALTRRLTAAAYGLGFDAVGIAALGAPRSWPAFSAWLDAGHHAAMAWLAGEGAALRADTHRPHPGATHAIVVAAAYGGREPAGPVARYARGDDYHDVLRARLRELHRWLEQALGHPIDARPYVDSGPILERDLARRAGLGWFGKNTMLIHPTLGSHLFLASLFVPVALEPSAPFEADRCGTCTRCLDACPTGALPAPRVLDARQCISYLTIEHRGVIPESLRAPIGGLLYGCDICNDVCPWTVKFSPALSAASPFAARPLFRGHDARTLAHRVLALSVPEYTTAFRGSAMKRAKLAGLRRNAAVVLGNVGTANDVPALVAAWATADGVLRQHLAWALGRIGSPDAQAFLEARLGDVHDPAVAAEVAAALAREREDAHQHNSLRDAATPGAVRRGGTP